jgi:hypothetical protein
VGDSTFRTAAWFWSSADYLIMPAPLSGGCRGVRGGSRGIDVISSQQRRAEAHQVVINEKKGVRFTYPAPKSEPDPLIPLIPLDPLIPLEKEIVDFYDVPRNRQASNPRKRRE